MLKKLSLKDFNKKEIIFGVIAIALIILFAISLSPKTLQNDTFYTVTIGKLISENGIDMKDHFSWHEGLPYTYPHWLYDVGMYQIYNLGGWDGIYISTCVFSAILGLCIYFANSRLIKNKLLSFAITIGVMYLIKSYIAARAQLVTFILFILLIYNIERFLNKEQVHDKGQKNQPKQYMQKNELEKQQVTASAQQDSIEGKKLYSNFNSDDNKLQLNFNSDDKLQSNVNSDDDKFKSTFKSAKWNVAAIIIIHILIANLHVAVWPFSFVLYLPYIGEYLIAELIDIFLYKKISLFFLKMRMKSLSQRLNNKKIDDCNNDNLTIKTQMLSKKIEKIQRKVEKNKSKREENIDKTYKIKIKKNKKVRWLILIMIIAVFTGLVSPFGKIAYTYTYDTIRGNTMKNINEHLPLTLINNVPIMCTLIILLATLTFTKSKIRLSDLLMLGGLCYLMFSSKRQQTMFVLIGSVAFTRVLNDFIKMNIDYPIESIVKKCFNKLTAFIMITVVVCLSINLYSEKKNDTYIDEKTYPEKASEWMLKNLDVKNIKLFNEYNYGSYLLYKGIPVFIDSRCDLYTPEYNSLTGDKVDGKDIFTDFINTSNITSYYGDVFQKYGITHVINYKNSKINMIITKTEPEKYKEIYSDDYFVIYEVLDY